MLFDEGTFPARVSQDHDKPFGLTRSGRLRFGLSRDMRGDQQVELASLLSMLSFFRNISENFFTPPLVPLVLALSFGCASSVIRGDESRGEECVPLVLGVGMLIGRDESSELKAFLLLADDGVLSSSPKKLFFLSIPSLPFLEMLSLYWPCLWLKKRISSTLEDVNSSGASVLTPKGFEANAGCCEGSGTGNSHSVAKSALTFGIESFSGEVIWRAVIKSISELRL